MAKKNHEKSGKVTVDKKPDWIDVDVTKKLNKAELNRIFTFFVFYSPCMELSAMSKSLEGYGWGDTPWKKPQSLQHKLKKLSNNPKLIFSAQTIDDMNQAIMQAELQDVLAKLDSERVAIFNNKRNQFMSVFYHLRNAFAHGRFKIIGIENDDYIFIFEDVKKSKTTYEVTARMVLRKSTLIKWIDLIEAGYIES